MIVERSHYKGGAFAAAVTTTSPVLDDLNTIISSPLLTAYEKSIFTQMKKSTIVLRNMKAKGNTPNSLQIITAFDWSTALEDVMSADMETRGEYVPPMMMQTLGDNGEIKESIVIDNNGGETHHKGGKPGVVPGAPSWFNEAQAKAHGNILSVKGDLGAGCYSGGKTSRPVLLRAISDVSGSSCTIRRGSFCHPGKRRCSRESKASALLC